MVVTFNNKDKFMKTKFLFLTALLALTPTLCTVSYGQNLLGTVVKSILGIANKNKAKTTDKTYITEDYKTQENKKNEENNENNTTNANDEIALIVSGKAIDSEKATSIALRSAIEQAYGTFVSANTTILNDDLVKDEIVTISNGNIKSYKVLSEVRCEDGQIMVTVDATVCISKLVSYAKSKGASAEFAGATFAQSMKMKELNKKNELQALQNLLVMTKEMLPLAYNMKLSIAEPVIPQLDARTASIISEVTPTYAKPFPSYEVEKQYRKFLSLVDGYYLMQFFVSMDLNDNSDKIFNNISNTLKTIALNQQEQKEYKEKNIKMSSMEIKWPKDYNKLILRFRNSQEDINKIYSKFINIFLTGLSDFEIVDNLGNTSSFNGFLMGSYRGYNNHEKEVELFKNNGIIWFARDFGSREYFTTQGTGLFQEGVLVEPSVPYFYDLKDNGFVEFHGHNLGLWKIKFKILASEISKYSDFKLASKSK